MAERVVINASPMIALLAIGQEGLLPMLFDDVLILNAVREEIEAGRSKDANVPRLATLTWLGSAPAAPIPEFAGPTADSCVAARKAGNCGLSLRYPYERDRTISGSAKTRGFSGSARYIRPPSIMHTTDLARYFVGIPQDLPPVF